MSEPGTRRRSGGREARRAVRSAATAALPYLTRSIPPYEILGEEGLATIEANAETILEEVGVEIVDFPEALRIYEMAGADVSGTRVRFPKGMCRELAATAPSRFTQVARNPERSVEIGDPHVVLAPAYGSPFVRDLEGGRRYATIEDFRNFARLTYMSPQLHHAGGTLCEPVDLPHRCMRWILQLSGQLPAAAECGERAPGDRPPAPSRATDDSLIGLP